MTTKSDLVATIEALIVAEKAMSATRPQGCYVQGPDGYDVALRAHAMRVLRLSDVRNELRELVLAC
jgi:hypothetical protein